MSLNILAYNLKRALRILGIQILLGVVGGSPNFFFEEVIPHRKIVRHYPTGRRRGSVLKTHFLFSHNLDPLREAAFSLYQLCGYRIPVRDGRRLNGVNQGG